MNKTTTYYLYVNKKQPTLNLRNIDFPLKFNNLFLVLSTTKTSISLCSCLVHRTGSDYSFRYVLLKEMITY